jgi:hypothetical protein
MRVGVQVPAPPPNKLTISASKLTVREQLPAVFRHLFRLFFSLNKSERFPGTAIQYLYQPLVIII